MPCTPKVNATSCFKHTTGSTVSTPTSTSGLPPMSTCSVDTRLHLGKRPGSSQVQGMPGEEGQVGEAGGHGLVGLYRAPQQHRQRLEGEAGRQDGVESPHVLHLPAVDGKGHHRWGPSPVRAGRP
jgi:hypothetical protein